MKNKSVLLLATLIALGFATQAWCFTPPATPAPLATPAPFNPPSDAFQVHYASNLNIGDSVINLTNGGTQGGTDATGNICANVYVFDPSEEMVACCACRVTPNALNSLSVRSDLISNTLTPGVPNSVVIKLLATKSTGSCNAATPTASNLASGLVAWGTNIHALPTSPPTYGVTENEFSLPQLSASEFGVLTQTCQFIENTASGFGICRTCKTGGL